MNYHAEIKKAYFLKRLCLEHIFRYQSYEGFVSRLVTERGLFVRHLTGGHFDIPLIQLVVMVDRSPDHALERTLRSWELQSCPFTQCQLIPLGENIQNDLVEWLDSRGKQENVDICIAASQAIWEMMKSEYVIFAKVGDIFHPSLATAIALLRVRENPDIVVLNCQHISDDGVRPIRFYRYPLHEYYSVLHSNYIGLSFAVKLNMVKQYPHDMLDHVMRNDGHLFHIWLSSKSGIKWATHPEYLVLRPNSSVSNSSCSSYPLFAKVYREMISGMVDRFEFLEQECSEQPYRLEPIRRADSISVIIPFRDNLKTTLRCLRAVLTQHFAGTLEVVLVNNQSSEESLKGILKFIEKQRGCNAREIQMKLIHYNHPFNHSRQCNLGVEESSGDVIVFLNNDAVLKDSTALDTLCSWALVHGIGTVGGRIVSKGGELVSAGIRVRLNPGFDYNAGVEESTNGVYSKAIREIFGNTFACAAISRSVFAEVGRLNEMEFPNGYNDVEYNLRTRQAGYQNMYLGHIKIEHEPGTSRGRSDEVLQKIMLRERFPELAKLSLFQLGCDEHLMERWKEVNTNKSVVERIMNVSMIKLLQRSRRGISEMAEKIKSLVST